MKIGLDLGGSLIKASIEIDKQKTDKLKKYFDNFIKLEFEHEQKVYYNLIFERKYLDKFYDFLKTVKENLEQKKIYLTGGGSFAYKGQIQEILGDLPIENFNEFKTIVEGIKHFENIFPKFLYTKNLEDNIRIPQHLEYIYPFLLSNIGTGISINLVEKDKHTHVSGSALGGASLQGFYRQFYPDKTYPDILKLIEDYHKQYKDKQHYIFQNFYLDYMQENEELNEKQTIYMIYEFQKNLIFNISNLTIKFADKKGIKSVVFSGNFLHDNKVAKELFFQFFEQINKEGKTNVIPYFLQIDGFLGSFTCLNELN